jgi:hypothetical protein
MTPQEWHMIAQHIVKRALEHERRKIHLGVIARTRSAQLAELFSGVPYHWKYMNMIGVSYARKDLAAAEAWALSALQAGYEVHVMRGRYGGGVLPLYGRAGYRLPNEEERGHARLPTITV